MSTNFGCSVCSFTSLTNAEATNHVNTSNANLELFKCPGAGCGIQFCLEDQTQGDDGHFKNCAAMHEWKAERKKGTNIKLPAVRQHCDISGQRTRMAHVTQGVSIGPHSALPTSTTSPAPVATTRQPKTKRAAPKAAAARKQTNRKAKHDKEGMAQVVGNGDETTSPAVPQFMSHLATMNAPTTPNSWVENTARYGPDPSKWPFVQAVNRPDHAMHELAKFMPTSQPKLWPYHSFDVARLMHGNNTLPREAYEPAHSNNYTEEEEPSEDEELLPPGDTPMQGNEAEESTIMDENDQSVDENK
jgi:hypothetical protein